MKPDTFTLEILPERLAVVRLEAGKPRLPSWMSGKYLTACLFTPEETTIICNEAAVPAGEIAENGWRALHVKGLLEFELVGVISGLTSILAEAGISIFALSTFSTDYLLVKEEKLAEAAQALRDAGHSVQ